MNIMGENTPVKNIITPLEWLKTSVTNPAYMWLSGIIIISSSSFLTGFLTGRLRYKTDDDQIE